MERKNDFLITLLSVLLLISVFIAGFFAYQTQNLVKELTKLQSTPTPIATTSPDPTADWKTYPSLTTIGLPYSFKYPETTEIIEAQDLVYFKTGNATIYHRFLGKQSDLIGAMNNFKPWGTNEQAIFSTDKKLITYNLLNGYKVTSSDSNNTFLFLGSDKLNGILVFHYPTAESESGQLLDQILSTFKFIEPVACTMDAKICPDGSSVGRSGPKCEFALCPTPKN